MLRTLFPFFMLLLIPNVVFDQQSMTENQRDEFLKDLVVSFGTEFLWEQKGKQIAKELQTKIDHGTYSRLIDPELFVETLNRDLFVMSNDRHLTVDLYRPNPVKKPKASSSEGNSLFVKEIIDEGVYYLKFDVFPKLDKDTKHEIEDIMSSLKDPRMIIIDLRDNSGGSDETVNYLAGYFFNEKTKLATSFRWNEEPEEIWALPQKISHSVWKSKTIILTSQATFSAAEVFTQRLQLHKRAVVIGERTPGAAHRTATYLMSDLFLLSWPYERSEHVIGQQDLEGIGIMPDHQVHYNSAKKAAIDFIRSNKIAKTNMVEMPKLEARIDSFLIEVNSEHTNKAFISDHIETKNQNKVLASLKKFKSVWNSNLNAKLSNVHYLENGNIRIFIETKYGTVLVKLNIINNRIAGLMHRL